MYTKQEIIIRSYRSGEGHRSISRSLGISRKTVRKYIDAYELRLRSGSDPNTVISSCLTEPPVFQTGPRSKRKLSPEIEAAIDKHMEENVNKVRSGLGKQQVKNIDILTALNLEGFDIGYTTVCNYIRTKQSEPHPQEAFIRQQYQPGESCEFDWGEVKLYIGGVLQKFQMAVFTSAYSNYRDALLRQRQDTLAFLETHVAFFEKTQGVFQTMVYDNMRVAVAKFVGKYEKEPTKALLQLRGHYSFSHRFCNFYRGNEKGHVERSVEYVRRKAFGIKTKFETIEEAERWLELTLEKLNNQKQQLTGKTANELLAEEQTALLPAPVPMACAEYIHLRVDKYATISFMTNRYSVPDHLVGHFVDAKIQSTQIELYQDSKSIARHDRSYQVHQWIISIEHYLETFKRKPGALAGSVALASQDYLRKLYAQFFIGASRDFITLLAYCHEHSVSDERLRRTVERLQQSGIKEIRVDPIIALLGNRYDVQENGPALVVSRSVDQVMVQDSIVQMAKLQLSMQTALLN